jgi:hypothetical protein
MKTNYTRINVTALLVTLLAAASILSSCDGDDPAPSANDVRAKLTASTWKMSAVTVDGTDQTALYKDLVLTFTNTAYSSVKGGAVWPASGTWSFTTTDATAILRNDGVVATIQELTDKAMKLELVWSKNTLGPGRIQSVSGKHIFTFGK